MKRHVGLIVLLAMVGCATTATPREEVRFVKPRTDADPVGAEVDVDRQMIRAGEVFELSVTLNIAPSYEIQDRHAPPPAIATSVELKPPAGFQAAGDWSSPQSVRSQWPDGHSVYVGEARFTRQVRVEKQVKAGEYKLDCAVRYQACNDRYCLPPISFKLPAIVNVQR